MGAIKIKLETLKRKACQRSTVDRWLVCNSKRSKSMLLKRVESIGPHTFIQIFDACISRVSWYTYCKGFQWGFKMMERTCFCVCLRFDNSINYFIIALVMSCLLFLIKYLMFMQPNKRVTACSLTMKWINVKLKWIAWKLLENFVYTLVRTCRFF